MAKVAIITDTHLGIRNDSLFFLDYFKKSFEEFFFPYLKENNIRHILHLGDLVDRRKYINFLTAKHLRNDFLDKLDGIETHIIMGNHDVYYKNTNQVNALHELVDGKYDVNIYDTATEVNIAGADILLLPWICPENYEESVNAIKNSKSEICMGHLEINGCEMLRGHLCDHGLDHKLFAKFDIVCSGHFHHRSNRDNIRYLGAFCEHTWSDYNDPRGFTVFDTETRELEFIQNPYRMFHMIGYDDEKSSDIFKTINETDYSYLKDSYVKVVCKNKTNPFAFDQLIDKLYEASPADIVVLEDAANFELDDEEIVDETQDTPTLLRNYISGLTLPVECDKVQRYVSQIYTEALAAQDI